MMKTWYFIFFFFAANQSFCQVAPFNPHVIREDEVNQSIEKPYFNINLNMYILNTSVDLLGLEMRFDHLFYNGEKIDYGYGLSARAGVEYDEDLKYSMSASFLGIYGANENKFEFSLGLNIPYSTIKNGYSESYEFLHAGIGYRFIPNDSPFTTRIGIATTGVINFGFGYKFPNLKN